MMKTSLLKQKTNFIVKLKAIALYKILFRAILDFIVFLELEKKLFVKKIHTTRSMFGAF